MFSSLKSEGSRRVALLHIFHCQSHCHGPAVLLQHVGVVHAGLLLGTGHVLRGETAVVLSPSSPVHVKL